MRTATAAIVSRPRSPSPGGGGALLPMAQGTRLGLYELVAPLAAGGMGHVWAAVRSGEFGFQRTFAVKVMREELAQDPGFRRMFLKEAKLSARIRHTNVVEVVDLGEAMGTVYLTMALVDGDSLSGLMEAARGSPESFVPPEIAARIVSDALRGLHAAHELADDDGRPLGLVHRDVSPHNILVGLDGVAKITDFGIAKAADNVTCGATTGLKGKLSYMAPEQLLQAELDRRADLFAAGVVLWELLAGRKGSGFAAQLLAGARAPDPRSVRPEAHPELSEIVIRALAKDPRDRYPSAEAMADAIDDAMRMHARPASPGAVAKWVQGLAGAGIAERREGVSRALTEVTHEAPANFPIAAPASVSIAHAAPRATPRRVALVVAALALAAATGALVWTTRGERAADKARTEGVAVSPSASIVPTADPGVPVRERAPTDEPTVMAATAENAPTAEPSAAASVTGGRAHKGGPSHASRPSPKTSRPKAAPSAKVQYDNPYGP